MCKIITKNSVRLAKVNKTSIYDVPYYVSDNTKIKKFYKWAPKKNIETILNDINKIS